MYRYVLIFLKIKLHFDKTNLWLTLGFSAFTLFGLERLVLD